MSAGSESSATTGPANSSGRSSPDHGQFGLANQPPHGFISPFGRSWSTRRSSTPASSFLPPGLWGMTSAEQQQQQQQHTSSSSLHPSRPPAAPLSSGGKIQQTNTYSGGEAVPASASLSGGQHQQPPSFGSVPRRTSFGHVLSGNRLSAFSAFGRASGPYWASPASTPTPSSSHQHATAGGHAQQLSTESVGVGGGAELRRKSSLVVEDSALSSANTTPAPSMPSSPVQKPTRKVYLPGPDGLICESRTKR